MGSTVGQLKSQSHKAQNQLHFCPFHIYLLSAYYVLDLVPSPWDTLENRTDKELFWTVGRSSGTMK